jgi:hypothetical protein
MFKVQLFGRDSVGERVQRDLGASFSTFELAIDAAEAVAANSAKGSRGTLTNYRITGVSGAMLLDVGVYSSRGRFTHSIGVRSPSLHCVAARTAFVQHCAGVAVGGLGRSSKLQSGALATS